MKIVLASGSPRRKELLGYMGLPFKVMPSKYEERIDPKKDAVDMAKELASGKAADVAKKIRDDALIIGADTIVEIDGTMLGKPQSKNECKEMLRLLSGKTHRVVTAICMIHGKVRLVSSETTHVTFRRLSEEDIESYASTDEPYDKAAYGIQGQGATLIKQIEGCFTNVLGFPVPLVEAMMRQLKILPCARVY